MQATPATVNPGVTPLRRKSDVDPVHRQAEEARADRIAQHEKALANTAVNLYLGMIPFEEFSQACRGFLEASGRER